MLNDYYEYAIGCHFLSAVINYDYSGLTDEDEHQLNAFLDNLPDDALKSTHTSWDYSDAFEGNYFAPCDVCGLDTNCVTVKLWFHNANIESITGA
jgi:hypothetical protein